MAAFRTVGLYQVDIHGIKDVQTYAKRIVQVNARIKKRTLAVRRINHRNHALTQAVISNGQLRLRFISYSTKIRHDVVDTESLVIHESPLEENEANVNYTHVLGTVHSDGCFLLLIEQVFSGIHPKTIGRYLSWMLTEFGQEPTPSDPQPRKRFLVELKAIPSEAFFKRIESLDRFTKASVTFLYHDNPGINPDVGFLKEKAEASNAGAVVIGVTAKRKDELATSGGFVKWIQDLFKKGTADSASAMGYRNKKQEKFSTDRLQKHLKVTFELAFRINRAYL